ncbi:MAG: SDR family oxidoreductase [Candidatus Izemoplasma sp.]|nr:SDR family oxidoreductase [Candidatus Izemoplasma sp.]
MRTILITGGSKGIGEGIVTRYLEEGDYVINIDILEPSKSNQPNYKYIACDIADEKALNQVLSNIEHHIDIIILNAATFDQSPFLNQSITDIKTVINTNLVGHIQIAQDYAKRFKGNHGRIIVLSSTRAVMSEKNTIGYTVSKGGLSSLVHGLAVTLKEKDITVNGIAPGWINSHDDDLRDIDHDFHLSNRVGKVEDIIKGVLFLTDPSNDFINGEIITIDGGVTRKMMYPE